jgi:ABC-type sugar transport system permease subunit
MAIALDSRPMRDVTAWNQLKTNRNWLAIWFMLPAAAFLILFLAYPLGLGVWVSKITNIYGKIRSSGCLSSTRCSTRV